MAYRRGYERFRADYRGRVALAGDARKQDGGKIFWTLSEKKRQEDLHIITSGNNDCPPRLRGSYLCVAGTEEFGTYSGPTGWGSAQRHRSVLT